MPKDVRLTALGSGYYRVLVDGAQVTQHTTEREASEEAVEQKLNNPNSTVFYIHDYSVTVDIVTLADPEPPPPPPPPSSSEPTYDSSVHNLIYQDDINSHLSADEMGATPIGLNPRLTPVPSPITTSQPVNSSTTGLITPGRGEVGKAIRMLYTGAYQQGSDWALINVPPTPDMATHFFRFHARFGYGGPLSDLNTKTIAIKFFMAWHRKAANTRIQWHTHWPSPCNIGSLGIGGASYWSFYDQANTGCQGFQPVGPYFKDVFDYQWHRFTMEYRPNSAIGAQDGIVRMWVDGTKIIDVSSPMIGVTPTGGEKPWCQADDVDSIIVNDGISYLRFGGPHTGHTVSQFVYDVDDLLWWTKQ
jgi:hypothetical protein